MNQIIREAYNKGYKSLSEFESKKVFKETGILVAREDLAMSAEQAKKIANSIGYPVVLKASGRKIMHKTELGLVKLGISSDSDLAKAYDDIMSKGTQVAELDGVLVQEMLKGNREFIIGLSRDPSFGPCVMFGLGGIFAEVLKDVSFRIAPLTETDAEAMIDEIKTSRLLDEFRGSPAVDRSLLIKALIGVGNLALDNNEIAEIDINPIIIADRKPVAVDGLVVLSN